MIALPLLLARRGYERRNEGERGKEGGRRRAEGVLGKVANAGCRAFVTGR